MRRSLALREMASERSSEQFPDITQGKARVSQRITDGNTDCHQATFDWCSNETGQFNPLNEGRVVVRRNDSGPVRG